METTVPPKNSKRLPGASSVQRPKQGWVLAGLFLVTCSCCSCQQSKEEAEVAKLKHAIWEFRSRITLSRDPQKEAEVLSQFVSWAKQDRNPRLYSRWMLKDPKTGGFISIEDVGKLETGCVVMVAFAVLEPGKDTARMIAIYEIPLRYRGTVKVLATNATSR